LRHLPIEERGQLRPFQIALEVTGIWLGLKRELIGEDCSMDKLAAVRALPAPTHITRDGGQPARTGGRVLKPVPVAPGFDERFLGKVLGGRGIAGKMGAEAYQTRALRCERGA
jgi:hypothetical protein